MELTCIFKTYMVENFGTSHFNFGTLFFRPVAEFQAKIYFGCTPELISLFRGSQIFLFLGFLFAVMACMYLQILFCFFLFLRFMEDKLSDFFPPETILSPL